MDNNSKKDWSDIGKEWWALLSVMLGIVAMFTVSRTYFWKAIWRWISGD